jgi:hypothetical protein
MREIRRAVRHLACKPGLLPHEVFAALHQEAPEVFRELLCGPPGCLSQWWKEAFQRGGDWLQNEYMHAAPADKRIPVGFHGDDGEYVTGEKVLVLSWGPVGPSGLSLSCVETRVPTVFRVPCFETL